MNLTSPVLKGTAHAAEIPGDSVTSFLPVIGDFTGLFAADGPGRAGGGHHAAGEAVRAEPNDAFAIRYRVL